MKPRRNKLNSEVFEKARERVKAAFPYDNVKMGFFTNDPAGASVFGGIAKVAKTVLMNIVGDSVNIRAYREPTKQNTSVLYKVDEYRGVNQDSVVKPRGSQVSDHHIQHDVPEDMMKQNNMSIEVVPDGAGGLKPNVQPDGMVKAYINFPDPTEEMLRRAKERAKNQTDSEEKKS
ncbi:MAG: hypothetical protein KGJ58_04785 [Patescibacteria group bacterium]|nr:hypothetical protein [Patescibacteria group bacterium]